LLDPVLVTVGLSWSANLLNAPSIALALSLTLAGLMPVGQPFGDVDVFELSFSDQ
jgi:hypothetical protein